VGRWVTRWVGHPVGEWVSGQPVVGPPGHGSLGGKRASAGVLSYNVLLYFRVHGEKFPIPFKTWFFNTRTYKDYKKIEPQYFKGTRQSNPLL